MYRSIKDFENDWKNEERYTLQILQNITSETKSIKIHQDVRTLERLAWHITQTIPELASKAGLIREKENLIKELPIPESFNEIINIYTLYNNILLQRVKSKWTDSILRKKIYMYGTVWTKGSALSAFIAHQIHHRAQITIIMRMLGLPVTGVYGPSKEEWRLKGLSPMD